MSSADSYWRGLERGELAGRICASCNQATIPPLPGCSHCGHEHGEVVSLSGLGTLYSWTVCHYAFDENFAEEVPYVVGLVSLAEGGRVVARIDARDDELIPDMPLNMSRDTTNPNTPNTNKNPDHSDHKANRTSNKYITVDRAFCRCAVGDHEQEAQAEQ